MMYLNRRKYSNIQSTNIKQLDEKLEDENIIDNDLEEHFNNDDLASLLEQGQKEGNTKNYYNFESKTNNEINVIEDVDKYRINDTANYAFYPNITPPRNNQIEKQIIVVINSKDRDLSLYPNTNTFQVKFSPNGNTVEIPTSINPDGSIKREPATLYKGYEGAVIQQAIKNIKHIRLLNVTVPFSPVYYNGNYPDQFNGQPDGKLTEPNDYLSNGYRPLWQQTGSGQHSGIPIDVLNEPYLLVDVDEIDTQQYFRSTNVENEKAFARVISDKLIGAYRTSSFAVFSTYSPAERMTYDPTLLSHLDKMTLHLKTQCNEHLYVGQDKIYVDNITGDPSHPITNECLGIEGTKDGAIININPNHDDYRQDKCSSNKISGHGLRPGDVVYFYSTRPCSTEFIYNLNNDLTNVKTIVTPTSQQLYIAYSKSKSISGKDVPSLKKNNKCETIEEYYSLRMQDYMEIGDYISLNGSLYLVDGFGKHPDYYFVNININYTLPTKPTFHKAKVGIVRQNKRGFVEDSPCSLIYKGGHHVAQVIDQTQFVIDLPFDNVPKYFQSNTPTDFTIPFNGLFFIKKHLQTSYMFEFTVVEKEYTQLKSDII